MIVLRILFFTCRHFNEAFYKQPTDEVIKQIKSIIVQAKTQPRDTPVLSGTTKHWGHWNSLEFRISEQRKLKAFRINMKENLEINSSFVHYRAQICEKGVHILVQELHLNKF